MDIAIVTGEDDAHEERERRCEEEEQEMEERNMHSFPDDDEDEARGAHDPDLLTPSLLPSWIG